MRSIRQLIRSDAAHRAVSGLATHYMRFVRLTSGWDVVHGEVPARFWDSGKPFILAFWHAHILMMPFCWRRGLPIRMLISSHRDGLLISRAVAPFGIETVTGSTTRGGGAALRAMVRALSDGVCVGITPDGPRGPRMMASEGVVSVARLADVPIIPCGIAMTRRRLLNSWDRFVLAWPFSRGICVWGDPITVPHGASAPERDRYRRIVEDALNAVTAEAESRAGRAPEILATS